MKKSTFTAIATLAIASLSAPAFARQPDEPIPAPIPAPAAAPPAARGGGADALVDTPPISEAAPPPGLAVRPYFLISGGLKYDVPKGPPKYVNGKKESSDIQNRAVTFALGRIGFKATWSDLVSAESEIMASGGTSLHGTSAYEGQAALQVRQQTLRLHRGPWRIEVGRFVDEASVNFFSAHVGETFLQDTATRDPLLYSGFNLGNGVRGQLELVPGLRAALAFNAGSPVSTTASLMVGGSFPPFERFYTQPYQSVSQVANHFPDDTSHILLLSPSLLLDTKYVDARAEVQGFDINTNTNKEDDDHIRGYNARGSVRAKLLDGLLVPFVNASYLRNDTVVASDLGKRAADRYQAVSLGGGVDVDVARRFKCAYDCADGIGVQYQQVQYQIGDGLVTTNRYANLGGTFWIAPNVSLGARLAYSTTKQERSAETGANNPVFDYISVIGALRFIMN